MSTATEKHETVIDAGTAFSGGFESKCPIVVHGRIDGKMSAPALTISKVGAVRGSVKVGELRCEGELAGEVDATTVYLGGRVDDQTTLRTESLEVKSNEPIVFGTCELRVGEVPKVDDVVAQIHLRWEEDADDEDDLDDEDDEEEPAEPEAKATDAKATDAKATDVKATDVKATDVKATDASDDAVKATAGDDGKSDANKS